jgi:hypothetical protein
LQRLVISDERDVGHRIEREGREALCHAPRSPCAAVNVGSRLSRVLLVVLLS